MIIASRSGERSNELKNLTDGKMRINETTAHIRIQTIPENKYRRFRRNVRWVSFLEARGKYSPLKRAVSNSFSSFSQNSWVKWVSSLIFLPVSKFIFTLTWFPCCSMFTVATHFILEGLRGNQLPRREPRIYFRGGSSLSAG